MPSLQDCRGAFNLQSSADISADCATFSGKVGSSNVIKGKFSCEGEQSNPGSSTSTSTASSTKKSEARHLDISSNAAIGIGSVLAAMLGIF